MGLRGSPLALRGRGCGSDIGVGKWWQCGTGGIWRWAQPVSGCQQHQVPVALANKHHQRVLHRPQVERTYAP